MPKKANVEWKKELTLLIRSRMYDANNSLKMFQKECLERGECFLLEMLNFVPCSKNIKISICEFLITDFFYYLCLIKLKANTFY